MAVSTRRRQFGAKPVVAQRRKIRAGEVGITQRKIAGINPHMTKRKQARRLAIRGAGTQARSDRLISGIEPGFKPRDGVLSLGKR